MVGADGEERRSRPVRRENMQQQQHRRATTRSSWIRGIRRNKFESTGEGKEQSENDSLDKNMVVTNAMQVVSTRTQRTMDSAGRENWSEPQSKIIATSDEPSFASQRQYPSRRRSRTRRVKQAQERREILGKGGESSAGGAIRGAGVSSNRDGDEAENDSSGDSNQGALHSLLNEESNVEADSKGSGPLPEAFSDPSTRRHGDSSRRPVRTVRAVQRSQSPNPCRDDSEEAFKQDENRSVSPVASQGPNDRALPISRRKSSDADPSERSNERTSGIHNQADSCISEASHSETEYELHSGSIREDNPAENRWREKLSSSATGSSSLPSLSSYTSSEYTNLGVDSSSDASSSPQPTQDGAAVSLPSLASFSSSEYTSAPSVQNSSTNRAASPDPNIYVIPEEQGESASSFASFILDTGAQQPTSELTMMCASASSFSKDGRNSSSSHYRENKGNGLVQRSESQSSSSSDRNNEVYLEFKRNLSMTPSSEGIPSSDNNDNRAYFSSQSLMSAEKDKALVRSSSKIGSKRNSVSPVNSRHSATSVGSVLGQRILNTTDLDSSQDARSFYDSGSMAYSEDGSQASARSTVKSVADASPLRPNIGQPMGTTPENESKINTELRRNSNGGESTALSSSSTACKSRTGYSHIKNKPPPYDGALLQLVEYMHGSASTGGNFNDSLSSFQSSSYHSKRGNVGSDAIGSKNSYRGSPATVANSPTRTSRRGRSESPKSTSRHLLASKPMHQSLDYVSSASSSSSLWKDNTTSAQVYPHNSEPALLTDNSAGSASTSKSGQKAPRRRSMNSTVSSSSESSGGSHRKRPPQKQPRRHSLGTPMPPRAANSPERRGPAGTVGSYSPGRNNATPKRGNSVTRLISIGLERGDSGYFSAASSTSRSTSLNLQRSNDIIGQSGGHPSVLHRGVRSSSPLGSRKKLRAEDLEGMRFSAPPRLGRIRSPRRRIIHILHHIEHGRSKQPKESSSRLSASRRSQRTSGQRVETSDPEDQVVDENLDKFTGGSGRSLPPRSPGRSRLNSPKGAITQVDPKAKTIRRGNRSVDVMPEIADVKQGRRRLWASTSSERRYRIVGLPPFVEDNEDNAVSSGSSSVDSQDDPYPHLASDVSQRSYADSAGRMSWIPDVSESSSQMTIHSVGTSSLPPRHRHRPLLQTIPSEHSMSSISHMTGDSKRSLSQSSSTDAGDIEPLTRMDRAFSTSRGKDNSKFALFGKEEKSGAESGVANPPVARMNSLISATSTVSNMSYDLQPVHLHIPGSPRRSPQPSSSTSGSIIPSSSPTTDNDRTELPLVPPLYRVDSRASAKTANSDVTCDLPSFRIHDNRLREDSSTTSSEDIHFARHANSSDTEWFAQTHHQRMVISAPSSPVSFDAPSFASEDAAMHMAPRMTAPVSPGTKEIWAKLRLEKERQEKLRKKLHHHSSE